MYKAEDEDEAMYVKTTVTLTKEHILLLDGLLLDMRRECGDLIDRGIIILDRGTIIRCFIDMFAAALSDAGAKAE